VFGTYLLAARVVGNLFPLSVFDMYRAEAPDVAARVLAIDAAGQPGEIEDFEAFVCETQRVSLTRIDETCGPDHRPLEYVVRDQELHIEAHRGDDERGAEPITIVSRAHALTQPTFTDCVITRCTARRRGDSR
jgi:hypothetical protein